MGFFPAPYLLRCKDKLYPYQPPAVQAICSSIVSNGVAIDGSDCGIGKTYHAIAVCREFGLQPAVVSRKSGLSTWQRVCDHFGIKPFFIVNWEMAKNGKFQCAPRMQDQHSGEYYYQWRLPKNTLLVFDEAHMASHDDSQNARLWQASKGRASLSLSATFADRPSRLRGLMNLLGAVKPEEFAQWLSSRGTFINQYDEAESLDPVADMKELHHVLYPRYGARLSDDDPAVRKFFPEAHYMTEIVDLGKSRQDRQNALYADLVRKVEYYRSLGKQAQALVADLRYRQETELLKVDTLVELVNGFITEGKSVCVFVNFRETLRHLAHRLHTRSLIYGNQENDGLIRDTVIDDFQAGRTRIMLSMTSAGGQSISLHDLDGRHPRVSLVCPGYEPISIQQVFGRTHRAGSRSTPVIKLVYAANTVEEKVAQVVNQKINNIKALNDGDLMEPDLFKILPERRSC